jgi:3'-phosphoadenosine 5'-phosphosulfate (PAPS) 3'-phosphatase
VNNIRNHPADASSPSSSSPPVNARDERGDIVLTTSRSHFTPQIERLIDTLRASLASSSTSSSSCSCSSQSKRDVRVIKSGGAGSKTMLLLDGKAHVYLYPSRGTKKWDTAAAEAIIYSAGGQFTDCHGREINYSLTQCNGDYMNYAGVLATLTDHQRYVINEKIDEKDSFMPSNHAENQNKL